MEEIFWFKSVDYNLWNNKSLKVGNLKTVSCGVESLTNLGTKIWNILLIEYWELKLLPVFKSKISNWVTDEWPCKCAKTVLQILVSSEFW